MVLATADPGTDLSLLAQYGVLGVFALLLILFAKTSYKRETDRSDRLEAEVLRLNNLIQEKAIPALASATRALEESQNLLHDLQRERDRDDSDLRRRITEIGHGQRHD
jgi:hypothetical protein